MRQIMAESLAPVGHLLWSASWIGAANQGLARFLQLTRKGGANRILESDLMAARVARVRMDLDSADAYLAVACAEVESLRSSGRSLGTHQLISRLNNLKVFVSERTFAAIDQLVLLGGLEDGYRKGGGIERLFRDLRSAALNISNDRLLAATGRLVMSERTKGLV